MNASNEITEFYCQKELKIMLSTTKSSLYWQINRDLENLNVLSIVIHLLVDIGTWSPNYWRNFMPTTPFFLNCVLKKHGCY